MRPLSNKPSDELDARLAVLSSMARGSTGEPGELTTWARRIPGPTSEEWQTGQTVSLPFLSKLRLSLRPVPLPGIRPGVACSSPSQR